MAELDNIDLPAKFTLYSQTTKSTDNFYAIKDELIRRGYEVNANDTICRQVSNRYEDLEIFASKYDKIVFVSGKKSSNGKVLFEVCKKRNPNTFFVSDPSELQMDWFNENDTVGICGATSTPRWLMEDVQKQLEAF
jgi:4-hydroxy-3-methylbut-2-enyl diphosphate reductase